MRYRLGFLGAGNMAEAIARAAIDAGVLDAGQLIAADPSDDRRGVFEKMGVATTVTNGDVIAQSEQVLLAVKPQMLDAIASDLAAIDGASQVTVSIMAGIRMAKLEAAIGGEARVVRVMPNTPVMVGAGMAGIALGEHAKSGDEQLAVDLFSAAGEAVVVPEDKLDAITALSGSGPAYLFYLAEAMTRAADRLGLADEADLLVRQTLAGAVKLLNESDDSAAELRRKVTSPGGTTEAACKHLDGNKTLEVIANAIDAARKRSVELGE